MIEIFYRNVWYPDDYVEKGKGRPEWFNFEDCYLSIIGQPNTSINEVIDLSRRDGVLVEVNDKYFEIKAGTDQLAFLELMKIIEKKKFDDDQIIYIVENDYMHIDGWAEVLIEGFECGDYVTLYDHPDKYADYEGLKSEIFVTKSCHWRTIPSTTNTFAVKYGTLKEDIDLHKYYAEYGIQGLAHDHTKFLDLGNKGRRIVSSIPGYSTHCNNYLSPCVDWSKI